MNNDPKHTQVLEGLGTKSQCTAVKLICGWGLNDVCGRKAKKPDSLPSILLAEMGKTFLPNIKEMY